MSTLLTNREMELFRKWLYAEYETVMTGNSIGLKPSVQSVAAQCVDRLSFDIDEDDLAECCEEVMGQWNAS